MSRIRSIKPEFWTSEQVVECSPMARLLFIGLWNFCDDAGRHPNSLKQIKAEVFPADEIPLDTIRGMILELSTNGLIVTYDVDGKELLQVTGWHHQRIDKPQKPKYPPQPDAAQDHSENVPRVIPPDTIRSDTIGADTMRARDDVAEARGDVVKAFEAGNSPNPPDTSRVELWKAQGYDLSLCVAVIREIVARNPTISTLNYFDNAIREAHKKRNPAPIKPKSIDWDSWAAGYARGSPWPAHLGPEPGYSGCRCPPETLECHGIDPKTGTVKQRQEAS